jgi:type II secretory pathway pseudopilin PulG
MSKVSTAAVRRTGRSSGFTYVWLLVALAIMAIGLAAVGELASTAAKREREAELLFAGNQIAGAIVAYRASSPGAPQYPQKLEDLLADNRYPNVRRYLRRVYPDPMTGRPDWGLMRGPGGGIVGLYSQSTARPLKIANFPPEYESFAGATSYAEWRFVPAAGGAAPAKPPAPGSPGAQAGKATASPTTGAAPTPFSTLPGAQAGKATASPPTGAAPTPFGTLPEAPSTAK